MMMVYLKETYINEFAETEVQETPSEPNEEPAEVAAIQGLDSLFPFDTAIYTIDTEKIGTWSLSNIKARINKQSAEEVSITITSAKSGSVDLIYNIENEDAIVKTITIKSL